MLQPGSQIGRYEIQRRLGRGGMGTVYVAHDPVLGRLVAIKVFATDLDLPDATQRFTREARSAASLNHPNIVTVHDYGDVESQPFIVMEYVQGETLADIIRRKAPIALTEKLRWIEELCAGASYAHRNGVLHRDIKPTNLMVNRVGQLKILDFGIARMIGTLSPKATALVGTPGYMAPEQILGESLDQRADLFSIGVVCYELLTYTEAFPGETLPTITHRILTAEPVPLRTVVPELNPDLIGIVERALRKNPVERFDDVETLRTAVARVRRQLENEAAWDSLAPTIIVERSGPGVSKRGTGSQRQILGDAVAVGQLTPPPESQRIDPDALQRQRTQQIEAHLTRSRMLLETGELDAALQACAEALTLEETHEGALELEQHIQDALETRRLEALRHEAEALRHQAADELGRHALTSAQDLLQQARELDPDNPDLKRLERELRLARVEATRQRQRAEALAAALERADTALANGETEAALAAARDALALDAGSERARELEAEAMRRLDEEANAQVTPLPGAPTRVTPPPIYDDLPPTVLSTRAAVQRGVESNVADLPPTIIAPSARRTPATAGARADVRTATPLPTVAAGTSPAPILPPSAPTVAVPPTAKSTGAGAVAKGRAVPGAAPTAPRPRRDYAGELRASVARAVTPLRGAWVARSARERTIIGWSAAGIVALIAVAVIVLVLPSAPIATGAVALDAVPWATVTRIEAEDGTVQPLPAETATPLLLTLPVGTYRVTLTGPAPDSESRVVTVSVQENGTATADVARFPTMTVEQYFEQYLTSSPALIDGAVGDTAPASGQPGVPAPSGPAPVGQPAGTAEGARP
jgi:serine/threonine protein kinase